MWEGIAWVGAFCFAVCGIPQALKCRRQGHAHGISHAMLVLWSIGEVCMLAYTLHMRNAPLFFNYAANLIVLGAIWHYRLWPNR